MYYCAVSPGHLSLADPQTAVPSQTLTEQHAVHHISADSQNQFEDSYEKPQITMVLHLVRYAYLATGPEDVTITKFHGS